MEQTTKRYARDLVSAVLYSSTFFAITPLIPFVAMRRLGASITWVGILNGGLFIGYLWNFFLSGVTARLSLRRGIVTFLTLSALLFVVAAFQTTAAGYSLIILTAMVMGGLANVQYDTLLYHLYPPEKRPKLLSWRALAVSLAVALYSPIFGRLTSASGGHRTSFLLSAALLLAGAFVFRSIRMAREHMMTPFGPRELLVTAGSDIRFRRLAYLLTIYGVFGVGIKTILVVFYNQAGFSEFEVGIFSSIITIGMILTNLFVTPRLHLRGGATNFRLCFTAGAVSAVLYAAAIVTGGDGASPLLISAACFGYGVAAGGFAVAAQTSVLNIAPRAGVSIYVNAFKIVQGIRGIAFPILIAMALHSISLNAAMLSLLIVSVICAVWVWVPSVDGVAEHPRPR